MGTENSACIADRVAKAADLIWEVGKAWSPRGCGGEFGHDMKNLSSRLHEARRKFVETEYAGACRTAALDLRSTLLDTELKLLRACRETGGKDGVTLAKALEIVQAIEHEIFVVYGDGQ